MCLNALFSFFIFYFLNPYNVVYIVHQTVLLQTNEMPYNNSVRFTVICACGQKHKNSKLIHMQIYAIDLCRFYFVHNEHKPHNVCYFCPGTQRLNAYTSCDVCFCCSVDAENVAIVRLSIYIFKLQWKNKSIWKFFNTHFTI